ncbi:MAG: cupin domain-containing protein, partial [Pseudomonadota bacterium]
ALESVMNWHELESLCNMTHIWDHHLMALVLDGKQIARVDYCDHIPMRDGTKGWMPNPDKVMEWLRQGASMVLDAVDSLTPGLRQLTNMLEASFSAKAQSNLYCSWQAHKAYATHCDTHDVFAVHFVGEKVWNLWQGRADHPINHPKFKHGSQAEIDQARGASCTQLVMRPGDVLYIPRGWYHDALASGETAVHIAFGLTGIIGLDVLDGIYATMIDSPLFRRNLPIPAQGSADLASHIGELARAVNGLLSDPRLAVLMRERQAGFRFQRGGIHLPVKLAEQAGGVRPEGLRPEGLRPEGLRPEGLRPEGLRPEGRSWQLVRDDLRLVRRGADWMLRAGGRKKLIPVPVAFVQPLRWVLERHHPFGESDLHRLLPGYGEAAKFLADLERMGLIRQAHS